MLLCDLQTHQIELELQNEVLLQMQHERDAAHLRYVDLYDQAPIGYCTVSENGLIMQTNLVAAKLLAMLPIEMVNTPITRYIFKEDQDTYSLYRKQLKVSRKSPLCELRMLKKDGTLFWAQLVGAIAHSSNQLPELRFVMSDTTERKQIEEEQIQHLKQQEKAARHLVASQEHLRQQLSSELHNRTSPNLAAIAINLKVIASELLPGHSTDLFDRMEDTLALIADTAVSIREISTEMRPPLLDYSGLPAAIENYAQQFTRRTGVVVQLDCLNKDQRYSPEVESQLFRIVQEALTNCLKHADASLVKVILSNSHHGIRLTISDDGIGFDFDLLGKNGYSGLGLLSMREMAKVIGGKFTLESAHDQGTQIIVDVM
jgi:PAS domain S-box-containing protein